MLFFFFAFFFSDFILQSYLFKKKWVHNLFFSISLSWYLDLDKHVWLVNLGIFFRVTIYIYIFKIEFSLKLSLVIFFVLPSIRLSFSHDLACDIRQRYLNLDWLETLYFIIIFLIFFLTLNYLKIKFYNFIF